MAKVVKGGQRWVGKWTLMVSVESQAPLGTATNKGNSLKKKKKRKKRISATVQGLLIHSGQASEEGGGGCNLLALSAPHIFIKGWKQGPRKIPAPSQT